MYFDVGIFFFPSKEKRERERNLNSYHRCVFLLFQLILYSIIIPTVCVCVYIYINERRERTFRNSRSHDCSSRTIVVFPLVFRLNRFSLFFLFPTVHFPFRRLFQVSRKANLQTSSLLIVYTSI